MIVLAYKNKLVQVVVHHNGNTEYPAVAEEYNSVIQKQLEQVPGWSEENILVEGILHVNFLNRVPLFVVRSVYKMDSDPNLPYHIKPYVKENCET